MTRSTRPVDKPARAVYASVEGTPELPEGGTEQEAVLAALPYLARMLIGAEYGALTVIRPSGEVETMYASGLTQKDALRLGSPPVGRGLLGTLGRVGATLRVERFSDHPDSVGFPPGHPAMESLLGIAVENQGGHAANLYLTRAPGRPPFTERDGVLVEMMARQAATALEASRLYRAEERLRLEAESARRWLEAVIREASAGIVVVDAITGEVILASPEAVRIVGSPLVDGAGKDDYERAVTYLRSDGAKYEISELPLQQAMSTGQPTGPVEVVFERADGRRIPTIVSAAPIPGGPAGRDAVIAVFQDTTGMKELEEVKSEFLSMITHDLRGPLATIKGLVSESAGGLEPESEARGDLEAIDEEVDQMTELVSNLLDMSRIEAGSHPLEREICHMIDLADDALRRARRSRIGTGREVTMDIAADLPPLYADPGQIGRVLDNLLSNALKYSGDTVALEAAVVAGGAAIRTQVVDHGAGVPREQLSAVFDRFFRVTGGPQAGWGAGLGLAICKSIVEAHGGEIGVESKEGEGSTFWFTVPTFGDSNNEA